MRRPRLLDLFCCAGGAAMGYHRAGFDVYGVDLEPQPNYPFPFRWFDAIELLERLIDGEEIGWQSRSGVEWLALDDFTTIHASPPCQASTALTKGTNKGREYPQLIPQTRELLAETGLSTIIENVQGSDLQRDLTLCGEMFDLAVIRHRYFEIEGFDAVQPAHRPHRGRVAGYRHGEWFDGPYFAVYGEGGGKGTVAQWQAAMGIDWTSVRKEIAEAIPPAYTEHIGRQLLAALDARAA